MDSHVAVRIVPSQLVRLSPNSLAHRTNQRSESSPDGFVSGQADALLEDDTRLVMQCKCNALQNKGTWLLVEKQVSHLSSLSNLDESRVSIRFRSSPTGSSRFHGLKLINVRRGDQSTQ